MEEVIEMDLDDDMEFVPADESESESEVYQDFDECKFEDKL